MARYLERAENTTRVLDVYQTLMLDLPRDAGIGWAPLLDILNCREECEQAVQSGAARDIPEFLTASPDNPGALVSSLSMARENARTTRDLLPTEAWRAVNELHLYAQDRLTRPDNRARKAALSEVIKRCQMVSGLLAATMSQDAPYRFIRIGRNLERADMTTRLVDVAAAVLMSGRIELERYNNTLWMAILRSLSAYQMYRQHVRRRVYGPDVIDYLMHDPEFPRAVRHCLGELHQLLELLPRAEHACAAVDGVQALLEQEDTKQLSEAELHQWIDDLQLRICALHDAICTTWFVPQELKA